MMNSVGKEQCQDKSLRHGRHEWKFPFCPDLALGFFIQCGLPVIYVYITQRFRFMVGAKADE